MTKHITISPNEAADRLAIRELVEAYAHCADRRSLRTSKGSCSAIRFPMKTVGTFFNPRSFKS